MKIQNDYISTDIENAEIESHPRHEKSPFAFRKG